MLNGELNSFIEIIDYKSKAELLEKLRIMRQNTVCLIPKERQIVKQMIGIAIQQVYHTPEKLLLQYANSKENA